MVNSGRKITQTTDLAFYTLKKLADSIFHFALGHNGITLTFLNIGIDFGKMTHTQIFS